MNPTWCDSNTRLLDTEHVKVTPSSAVLFSLHVEVEFGSRIDVQACAVKVLVAMRFGVEDEGKPVNKEFFDGHETIR